MIITEIAKFKVEDCLFKLADISDPPRPKKMILAIDRELMILGQQSKTSSWLPIGMFRIESTNVDSVIKEAKKYVLWKSVNCLKHDFKQCAIGKDFYKSYPQGISDKGLSEPKTKHILFFGKYKGQELENVMQFDPDYVFQVIESVGVFRGKLEKAVDNIWDDIMCEKSEARNNLED